MSEKLINDNTPYFNRHILDLPFYRELFVDHKTSTRADIYHTRKNTQETNKNLAEIINQWKNNNITSLKDDYSKLISDVIVSSQQWYNNIWSWLDNISGWLSDLWYWIDGLSNNIESFTYELQDSIASIYGSSIPEWKSFVDIWRDFSFNGKRAIVSLYIHGGISWSKMRDLFSNQFIDQLDSWVSTKDARLFQRKVVWELDNLKLIKKNIDNSIDLFKQNNPWLDKNILNKDLNELEKRRIIINQNINKVKAMLVYRNEIDLLDIWLVARSNDIATLIQRNIINTDILEVLVRNRHVSWNLSNQLSRIIEVNENWVVKPLIELDGITWIYQQQRSQTLLQNIIAKQWKVSNEYLWNIDNNLKTWFIITNQSLNNIWSFVQETNRGLWIVNKNLDEVNWNLWGITYGVTKVNEELWIVNQHLNTANWNLENINSSISETNIYLNDILSVNSVSNDLLFEWNQLQQVTNQYLDAINETILYTSEWLANILWWIWNVIADGFDQTIEWLNQMSIIQQEQLMTNKYILNEIENQTAILQNIDNKLDNVNRNLNRPMEIQANESFRQWIDSIKISELKLSLSCFKKWLKHSPTHLWNNFAAGIIYKSFWNNKKAIRHLTIALNKAISENDSIVKKIYYELAKAEIKQLNLEKGQELLDSASWQWNIALEIDFAQADVLIKLWKEIELDLLLWKIVNKIFSWSIDISWYEKHNDVLIYLRPKIDIYIKILFKKGDILHLVNSIDILLLFWMNDKCEKIIKYLLENNPDILYTKKIKIDKIIKNNPSFFNKVLKDFWVKKIIGWTADTFFYIANAAYRSVDQKVINLIISKWLEFDSDYINMEYNDNQQSKSYNKTNIINKIYSFWDNAKYMLRDYLKTNNIF